jgi:HrpA-like RNA helicase
VSSTHNSWCNVKPNQKKILRRKKWDLHEIYSLLYSYSVAPIDEEAEMEGGSDLDLSDDENDLGNHDDVDDDDLGIENVKASECSQPLYVLPLYSLLSTQKQAKVSYCTS